MRKRYDIEGVDLVGSWGWESLEGAGGRKTVITIYYKEKNLFLWKQHSLWVEHCFGTLLFESCWKAMQVPCWAALLANRWPVSHFVLISTPSLSPFPSCLPPALTVEVVIMVPIKSTLGFRPHFTFEGPNSSSLASVPMIALDRARFICLRSFCIFY